MACPYFPIPLLPGASLRIQNECIHMTSASLRHIFGPALRTFFLWNLISFCCLRREPDNLLSDL
jgi:hypothetical protein